MPSSQQSYIYWTRCTGRHLHASRADLFTVCKQITIITMICRLTNRNHFIIRLFPFDCPFGTNHLQSTTITRTAFHIRHCPPENHLSSGISCTFIRCSNPFDFHLWFFCLNVICISNRHRLIAVRFLFLLAYSIHLHSIFFLISCRRCFAQLIQVTRFQLLRTHPDSCSVCTFFFVATTFFVLPALARFFFFVATNCILQISQFCVQQKVTLCFFFL